MASSSVSKRRRGSEQTTRDALDEQYDRLLSQLGGDPYARGGMCPRVDGAMDQVTKVSDTDRDAVLAQVTEKSVQCVELVQKAMGMAHAFRRVDETILAALNDTEKHKTKHDADVKMLEEEGDEEQTSDAEDDEAAVLVLEDLVAASDELQQASCSLARLGVVAKSKLASQGLLTSGKQYLDQALGETQRSSVDDAFRALYVEEFTSAFGDELDQFRQEERFEAKDVSCLISCIQSGADAFTPLQKRLFVDDQ